MSKNKEMKTCGECRYYFEQADFCRLNAWECIEDDKDCCEDFALPTNGDKIRQGSDKELVIYKHDWSCHVCIYHDEKNKGCHCSRPNDKTCLDGMIAWLEQEAKNE